jgi:serine/threonine protein kinase
MPDITHLDDNAASEFVSGSLSASAQSKIEAHLASCRDCRALVAALAMDAGADSNAATVPHERISPSQVAPRPTRTLTIGDRVGRYLVLSALGAGGMGVVFAAYDPQLDRKVALKLLRAGITYNTKDARTRLRREAQAIAQLSHPNVVGVYDVGTTEDGDLYIAMEFVEGDTLTSWLKKYPRTWREIVDVFLQAARGLLAAHSVGLLHRDFKPDNVLVGGDGRVRVTDFGLARSLITPEDGARPAGVPTPGTSALNVELTATGTVLGTPRYMAPEQLTGPDIDARADQFSFCVALYEALYGGHPLPGATSVAMLEKHEKAAPPPEGAKVPSAIARAVMTGLERERARRFPTMGALISALVPAPRRSPARYAAVALAGILATGGAVAAALNREPAEVPVPVDDQGKPLDPIGPLVMKINELQEQLNQRDAENRALVAELTHRKPDVERIQQLQTEIALRDDKIEKLVREVAELKGTRLPRRQPPRQEELANGALERKIGDLESCLVEWSLRQPGDAELKFQMTASSTGAGHGVEPLSPTDKDDRVGPSLRQCVGDVLGRVQFAPGPDNLDLHVYVKWIADMRSVVVSANIVRQRKATQTLLD